MEKQEPRVLLIRLLAQVGHDQMPSKNLNI